MTTISEKNWESEKMIQGKYYRKITSESKALDFNFKELIGYRDLIMLLVKKEFVSKYKQTILGPAWAIIQPLFTTVVFTFIFGNVAGLAECGAVPTFLFYMCGNILWQFFAGCLQETANTFINNSGTMGKVYFPRLCVPVATVLGQFISFAIQFIMFILFLIIYMFIPGFHIEPNLIVVIAPVLVIQLGMLGLGVGIIVSACTTKYRDLRFAVGFGVSLWMYATPVAYSVSIFRNSEVLRMLSRINPVTPIIELMRYGFLGYEAGSIDWLSYGLSWIATLFIFGLGVILFNKVEKTFMDTV